MAIAAFLLWWMTEDQTGLSTVVTECIDMLVSMLVVLVFVFSRRGIVSVLLSKEKTLYLGNISLDFYLVHYLVIHYGIIAAKHFGFDNGIIVLLLTILFFVISLFGAYLIHSFTERLLKAFGKKKQTFNYSS